MADVWMTESRQASLRDLAAAEPMPGHPLPPQNVLELVNRLVPCDLIEVGFTDPTGRQLAEITLAPTTKGHTTVVAHPHDPADHGEGPYFLGWIHWTRNPQMAEECNAIVGVDDLSIGFRNGVDHVVQYGFARETTFFSEEELALMRMVAPLLGRLAHERPVPSITSHLTRSERRILHAVAGGHANSEIAESLCVAESTVRKHLENSYRKLGVSNRMAAVARVGGADLTSVDLRGRLETFA
jgi:DNA-binding CsgD family transcriptional regulator